MNLEQALQENTKAVLALAAALAAGGAIPAAAPAKTKAAEKTTTTTAPAAPATPAADAPKNESPAAVTFDQVKEVFLKLGNSKDGRARCEAVLKPYGVVKLSLAKPADLPAIFEALTKALAQ